MQTPPPPPPPVQATGPNFAGIDYSSFAQPSDSFQVFGGADTGFQQHSPFTNFDQQDDIQGLTNGMHAMNLGAPVPAPAPVSTMPPIATPMPTPQNNEFRLPSSSNNFRVNEKPHNDNFAFNNGTQYIPQQNYQAPQPAKTPVPAPKPSGKSKFSFGEESPAESIEELELKSIATSLDKSKFEQAKLYIGSGNLDEADAILKDLLEQDKIEYKQMNYFDNNIFMDSFAPISDSN